MSLAQMEHFAKAVSKQRKEDLGQQLLVNMTAMRGDQKGINKLFKELTP